MEEIIDIENENVLKPILLTDLILHSNDNCYQIFNDDPGCKKDFDNCNKLIIDYIIKKDVFPNNQLDFDELPNLLNEKESETILTILELFCKTYNTYLEKGDVSTLFRKQF